MTTKMATLPAERIADCINFVVDKVGHALEPNEREVLFAAMDFIDDQTPTDAYAGPFDIDGGYMPVFREVIFATACYVGRFAVTADQRHRCQMVAWVGMS